MRDLNFQLKQLCKLHKEDSFRTRSDRSKGLQLCANQLHEMGYRQMKATSLKEKHVTALVEKWQAEGVTDGSIKNRMSMLRWWANKINRPVVANDNSFYGIGRRTFVTNTDKSSALPRDQLSLIKDPYIRVSLLLQEAFGLRREEAIKFSPSYADKGSYLKLKGSWTKGGKPRSIPIVTKYQKEVLQQARALVGLASLIPANKNFIQQLRIYERQTANAGLSRMHGLRHAYAQTRYELLMGMKSPAAGGIVKKQMSALQKTQDYSVRMQISKELGHEREQITAVYLGR